MNWIGIIALLIAFAGVAVTSLGLYFLFREDAEISRRSVLWLIIGGSVLLVSFVFMAISVVFKRKDLTKKKETVEKRVKTVKGKVGELKRQKELRRQQQMEAERQAQMEALAELENERQGEINMEDMVEQEIHPTSYKNDFAYIPNFTEGPPADAGAAQEIKSLSKSIKKLQRELEGEKNRNVLAEKEFVKEKQSRKFDKLKEEMVKMKESSKKQKKSIEDEIKKQQSLVFDSMSKTNPFMLGSMVPGSLGSMVPGGSMMPGTPMNSMVPMNALTGGSMMPSSMVPGSMMPGSMMPGTPMNSMIPIVGGSMMPGSMVPGMVPAIMPAGSMTNTVPGMSFNNQPSYLYPSISSSASSTSIPVAADQLAQSIKPVSASQPASSMTPYVASPVRFDMTSSMQAMPSSPLRANTPTPKAEQRRLGTGQTVQNLTGMLNQALYTGETEGSIPLTAPRDNQAGGIENQYVNVESFLKNNRANYQTPISSIPVERAPSIPV